jgi:WD40 repeat protein
VVDADDPYGVLSVSWPTSLGWAARLLDRLPTSLGRETRSPVVSANVWLLVGNIPILANADDGGRVLVGYGDQELDRLAIAQPSGWPAGLLGGFFLWGGAPEHCVDAEGSPGVIDGDLLDLDGLSAADAEGSAIWAGCTMQQNPDTGNEIEAPDDWAYGMGWTSGTMTWFVVARSREQRDELVAELLVASSSEAPPSDPNNPIFDVDGPAAWWPGGLLVTCAMVGYELGLATFDPVTGEERLILESRCGQASVSPDGELVVFDDYDSTSHDVIRLYVSNLEGAEGRPITDPAVGDAPIDGDVDPEWSPTGEWIAFQRQQDQIHVVRPDGTGIRFITTGRTPRWSSDGTMLLVRRDDGVAAVRLSDGETQFVIPDTFDAAWSPDGTVIAYVRDDVLRLWSPAAGDLGIVDGLESLGDVEAPVWSPDGRWILVSSGAYGSVILDPATATVHALGPHPGDEGMNHIEWIER